MFWKSNDFAGRPYAYLTNQVSHFLLGFFAITTYIWLMYVITGVYINQSAAIVAVVGFYLICIEFAVQGWRGEDTLQDTYFFALGCAAWYVIDMSQVIHRLMLAECLLVLSLSVGTLREISRRRNEQ